MTDSIASRALEAGLLVALLVDVLELIWIRSSPFRVAQLERILAVSLLGTSGIVVSMCFEGGAPVGRALVVFATAARMALSRNHPSGDLHLQLMIAVALAIGLNQSLPPFNVDARTALVVHLGAMYGLSGMHKLRGVRWRDGSALHTVLSTASYGLRGTPLYGVAIDLRSARWLRMVTWSVLLVELATPVLLYVGGSIRVVLVVVLSCMHVGIGAVMGLRRFSVLGLCVQPVLLD